MLVRIRRIDKKIPLPIYQTKGSVGCDLAARVTTKIPAKSLGKIPLNVIIETPPGFMFMVVFRSSTPYKKSLFPPNGFGVGDQDYCGSEDEYILAVYNFSDEDVVVKRGERIAQGIFVPVGLAQWLEIEEVKNKSRGGFGSTGGHK